MKEGNCQHRQTGVIKRTENGRVVSEWTYCKAKNCTWQGPIVKYDENGKVK